MQSLTPWIQRTFLISAFIASLSCFARADYNLPLYIFAYMAWGLQRVIMILPSTHCNLRVKNQE